MINITEAAGLALKEFPEFEIQLGTLAGEQYVFMLSKPGLKVYDPFVSVHSQTGEVSDYPMLDNWDVFRELKPIPKEW